MFGVELFQEVKSFKGKIESTLEHMKSVESEIIKIQKQTNQMFRQVTSELHSFEILTQLRENVLKSNILLTNLFNNAEEKKDFSHHVKSLFGNLQICNNKICPLKLSEYKGCSYRMNQTDVDLLTIHISNTKINSNLKVLSAHPFPIVHWPIIAPKQVNFEQRPMSIELISYQGDCEPIRFSSRNTHFTFD
ncbi:hypothetical protein BLOT_007928 [Blomia tropicalis]|nr:hypothetical protein BLOT_007928 [Blomia tropicalis]